MQNKSKLGEKVSLGNTSRMLPPLSLCSFISLHSFIEDLNSSVLSGNDSLGVFSGKKIEGCSPFHRNHWLKVVETLRNRIVFFIKTHTYRWGWVFVEEKERERIVFFFFFTYL